MKVRTMIKLVAGALSFMLALSAVPAETVLAEERANYNPVNFDERMTDMDVSEMSEEELAEFDAKRAEISFETSRKDAVRRTWKLITRYQYNADGSVYSHTDYTYDTNGNRLNYIRYDGAGTDKIEYKTTSIYDANGNEIKEESIYYDSKGNVSSHYVYTYNADGYQSGYEGKYYSDGKLRTHYYDTFDGKGNRLTSTTNVYNDDGTVDYLYGTEYAYDANGLLVKAIETWDGKYDGESRYTYDANGNEIKEEYYSSDGSLWSIVLSEYDANENITKSERYYVYFDQPTLSVRDVWTYDANGNMTSHEAYEVSDSENKLELRAKWVYGYSQIGTSYMQTSYFSYKADGTINSGWIDEYDTNGNYVRCINYGENGVVESYEYSGALQTPNNAKPGDTATAVNETYDANMKLLEKMVYTYQLFEYNTDNTPSKPALNGLNAASDGNWYKYVNGAVDTNYTGLYCDTNYGWWLVVNGKVASDYNGLYGDANYGWWLVNGGAVNFSYSGLYGDANYGWWLVEGGAVNFSYTGLYGDVNYGWWLVNGGAVNFGYTGLYGDVNCGWWLVEGGAVNFSYTGLYGDANYGWWLVTGGAVDFGFSGLYNDPVCGWWKVAGGAVDFGYTGTVEWYGGTYNVVNGCLVF